MFPDKRPLVSTQLTEVRKMRTKRYISLLLAALMALSLAGCGAKDDKKTEGDMTVRPAQLSEEENALVELLGVELGNYHIFDFQVEGAKSVQIAAYELVGDEWSPVTAGGGTFIQEGAGRIALMFGKMNEGVSVRYQGENGGGGTKFAMPGGDSAGMFYATSTLTSSTPVELEQEVPLAIQIATTQSEIHSYDVQYFGMPREYAKHGYEHVYAITVTFSGQSQGDAGPGPSAAPPSGEPSPSPAN